MIFPGEARQLLCITEAEVVFPAHVIEMGLYASLLHGTIHISKFGRGSWSQMWWPRLMMHSAMVDLTRWIYRWSLLSWSQTNHKSPV